MRVPGANALTSSLGVRYASQGPGYRRSQFLHSGADFPGVLGEPVLAIMPGEVVGVYVHRGDGQHDEVSAAPRLTAKALGPMKAPYGFGLHLIIRHTVAVEGQPLHSGYHHLDSALVRRGDKVAAGQPVGTVGKSGTNPVGGAVHLHLDVARAPAGAPRSAWFFLDPRGFQRWSSSRTSPPGATGPGTGKIWPVTEAVVAPAFPRSGTARGVVGVDRPAPPIVAEGPGQPLDQFWRVPRDRPVVAVVAVAGLALGFYALSRA